MRLNLAVSRSKHTDPRAIRSARRAHAPRAGPAAPRRPVYDLKLAALAAAAGELVRFEDLASY
ncbi:MAG TPA: hypothetical protein VOA80_12050 [Thermoanaerobaculia bacterium]|nr:hypothetical protein [Thermoanaerobaculia bacterium]